VVLDAVVDPAFVLYMDVDQDGGHALELFFMRCEADPVCSSTFPRLRSEFDVILRKLDEIPAEVTIPHPVTGNPLQLDLTRRTFTNIIFNTLYSPDLVAMLPLAIHQAYAERNYAPLISQAYLLDAGVYDGMFYAVACTEDAPLLATQDDAQGAESIFGDSAQAFIQVCSAWPRGDRAPVVRAPVDSDVPVLMLSGEADPITPPWHAEQLASSLRNSLHLIFDDMGHGNSASQCTAKILDSFIESASVSSLDTSCVERVEPPPFFVDFSGPQP
jgi:pimeloyl-ACP methyl ester carboxylesterase